MSIISARNNDQRGTKNSMKITANIFISFIGAGVLGLPFAFKESGLVEGIVVMICVAIFSVKAMILIIDCKAVILSKKRHRNIALKLPSFEKVLHEDQEILLSDEDDDAQHVEEYGAHCVPDKDLTYGDIGYEAFGAIGQWIVDAVILVSQIGFSCAYLIFISKNLSNNSNFFTKNEWLMLLLVPLFFLTLLRHLHNLAIFSFFAQISNVFAFAVVFWFDFDHYQKVEKRFHPKEFSFQGLPFFFAVAVYCYEGAGMILCLESSLLPEIRHKFKRYFVTTLFCITVLYIVFGVCGYLSFGLQTNEIITLNLPKSVGINFPKIVTFCLCLSLFFCYPVMMFPVTALLEEKLFCFKQNKTIHRVFLRLLLVALSGLIVIGIPNFSNLMGFVGASCGTLLSFILPGLFHLKLNRNGLKKSEIAFDIWLIVLGTIACLIGTIDSIRRMMPSHQSYLETIDKTDHDFVTNSSKITY